MSHSYSESKWQYLLLKVTLLPRIFVLMLVLSHYIQRYARIYNCLKVTSSKDVYIDSAFDISA